MTTIRFSAVLRPPLEFRRKSTALFVGLWIASGVFAPAPAVEPPWSAAITIQRIDDKKTIEGRWALSAEWAGFMGLALELRDGKFRYWFLSDVGTPGQFPITGIYTVDHGFLELITKGDVYATRWLLITHDGRTGLFPISDFETIAMRRESPPTRMIFKLTDEEAKGEWPRYNVPKRK